MLVRHNLFGKKKSKEVKEEVGFLLTNKLGGFFSLGVSSIYSGLFFRYNDHMLKVIEDIKTDGKLMEIENYVPGQLPVEIKYSCWAGGEDWVLGIGYWV